jgi:hypothetical protein
MRNKGGMSGNILRPISQLGGMRGGCFEDIKRSTGKGAARNDISACHVERLLRRHLHTRLAIRSIRSKAVDRTILGLATLLTMRQDFSLRRNDRKKMGRMTHPTSCRTLSTSSAHTCVETSARRINSAFHPRTRRWSKLSPDWQPGLLCAKISHLRFEMTNG